MFIAQKGVWPVQSINAWGFKGWYGGHIANGANSEIGSARRHGVAIVALVDAANGGLNVAFVAFRAGIDHGEVVLDAFGTEVLSCILIVERVEHKIKLVVEIVVEPRLENVGFIGRDV